MVTNGQRERGGLDCNGRLDMIFQLDLILRFNHGDGA